MTVIFQVPAINVPDANAAEVLAVLQTKYGTNGNPTPTKGQIEELMRQEIIRSVRVLVAQTRAAAAIEPNIT